MLRAVVLMLALSACAADRSGAPVGQTWIAVTGPAGSEGPEDLVLEIGDTAWFGYGGVVSVEAAGALDVRLVGRDSCRSYANFSAPAATMWVIRFAEDESVRIEDWTGKAMDTGPALGEREPSGCPR